RLAGIGAESSLVEVVAVQRAGDHAGLALELQVALQALGEPGAAGPDAHERAARLQQAAHAADQIAIQRFGIEMKFAHDDPSSDEYISRSPEGMRAGLGAARRSARGHDSPSVDGYIARSPQGMRAGLGAARRSAR